MFFVVLFFFCYLIKCKKYKLKERIVFLMEWLVIKILWKWLMKYCSGEDNLVVLIVLSFFFFIKYIFL